MYFSSTLYLSTTVNERMKFCLRERHKSQGLGRTSSDGIRDSCLSYFTHIGCVSVPLFACGSTLFIFVLFSSRMVKSAHGDGWLCVINCHGGALGNGSEKREDRHVGDSKRVGFSVSSWCKWVGQRTAAVDMICSGAGSKVLFLRPR